MPKLSNSLRDQIVKTSLQKVFGPKLDEAMSILTKEVIKTHSNTYKVILSKLTPDEIALCFSTTNQIEIQSCQDTPYFRVDISEYLPVIEGASHRCRITINEPTKSLSAVIKAWLQIRNERSSFEADLRKTLSACATTKQLAELVPSLASFDKNILDRVSTGMALVPVEQIARVNQYMSEASK